MNKEETKKAVQTLVTAYHSTTSPAATIKAAIAKQGVEATEYALAYIVNYYHWDGRISQRNKDKAAQIDTYKGSIGPLLNAVHLAHVDQLMDALRRK